METSPSKGKENIQREFVKRGEIKIDDWGLRIEDWWLRIDDWEGKMESTSLGNVFLGRYWGVCFKRKK